MKTLSSSLFLHRPGLRAIIALASVGLLQTACVSRVSTDAHSGIPFTCAGDHLCPAGYRCSSDYCIAEDAADLPTLLGRSETNLVPQLHPDPDRGGVMACWSRFEDFQQPDTPVYASFLSADGTVHSTIRVGSFDTRNSAALTTCAPVPQSGGKIVVGAWLQQYGTATFRYQVWTPNQGDPYNGTTRPFLEESQPFESATYADAFRAAVVGNEAWFPMQQPRIEMQRAHTPPYRVVRMRFDAHSLETGIPIREVTVERTPQAFLQSATFIPSDDGSGAWLYMSAAWAAYGFSSRDTVITPFSTTLPLSNHGFGLPLHARSSMGMMGTQQEMSMLWRDSVEAADVRNTYRLAWMTWPNATTPDFNVRFGPRLPFSRIVTPSPGAFHIGDTLYVFGSPAEGVTIDPAPWDGGMADASSTEGGVDASLDDIALEDVPPPSAMVRGTLTMYSIAWGAADTAQFTVVREIPRVLGNAVTPTVRAMPMPDGHHFALLWVDFLPADIVGRGARYALYLQQFSL